MHYRCQHCKSMFLRSGQPQGAGGPPAQSMAGGHPGAPPPGAYGAPGPAPGPYGVPVHAFGGTRRFPVWRRSSGAGPVVGIVIAVVAVGMLMAIGMATFFLTARTSSSRSRYTPSRATATATHIATTPAIVPPAKATLTSSDAHRTRTGSYFWLVEYQNVGSTTISGPAAEVTLMDTAGTKLRTAKGFAVERELAPGDSTTLLVLATAPPKFDKATVAPHSPRSLVTPTRTTKLAVREYKFTPTSKTLGTLTGKVDNTSGQSVRSLRAFAVGKNAKGESVSYGSGSLSPSSLIAGRTGSFRIVMGAFEFDKPDHYEVVVVGTL